MNYNDESIKLHEKYRGKWESGSLMAVNNLEDLSVVYTPGVAAVCKEIQANPERAYDLTMKARTVAVITDGTAILGLGNIGSLAGLPVMEGKCVLYKQLAGVDAVPLCLEQGSVDEIVDTIVRIAPSFGAIQLEDFAAPHCFEVTEKLEQRLSIPVMQDDQFGTATVVLAGLLNALKVVEKDISDISVVISGAGAAGLSIAHVLLDAGVTRLKVLDSKGTLTAAANNPYKVALAEQINPDNIAENLPEALVGADVFVGVSQGGIMSREDVAVMNEKAIVFALANPTPEIMPDEAKTGGAYIVATGRSDFPNQINNVLAYPGLFRGILDARLPKFTRDMYVRAAHALAAMVAEPTVEKILPSVFDEGVSDVVARAITQ